MEILNEYTDEVVEEINEAVEEVAKESLDDIKTAGTFSGTGKYRKGWKITYNRLRYGLEATIHNKVYMLTHLLESGHAKFLWGKATGEDVKAFPHIADVNDQAQRKLEEEIKRRLS